MGHCHPIAWRATTKTKQQLEPQINLTCRDAAACYAGHSVERKLSVSYWEMGWVLSAHHVDTFQLLTSCSAPSQSLVMLLHLIMWASKGRKKQAHWRMDNTHIHITVCHSWGLFMRCCCGLFLWVAKRFWCHCRSWTGKRQQRTNK